MSDFHEIWKWEDAQKRLEFARKYTQAGASGGDVRLERMVNELALCGETIHELKEANAVLRGRLAGRNIEAQLNNNLRKELQIVRRLFEAKSLECARLQKRVEELEKAK